MRCDSMKELLSAMADGEADVSEHLAACEDCRRELALLKSLKKAMGTAPLPAMPGDLRQALLKEARRDRPTLGERFEVFLKAWRLPLGAAAGALAAAALLLSVGFGAEEPLPLDVLLNAHSRYAQSLPAQAEPPAEAALEDDDHS